MEISDQLIEIFCALFIHCWTVYALQRSGGGYYAVRRPITLPLVRAHLQGKHTLGFYALAEDETARWACIDSDLEEGLTDLQGLCLELRQLGIPTYLENSRRGAHLWLFFEPMEARVVYYFTHSALKRTGFQKPVEIFPKQQRLNPGGVGSLVRAPLGVHRVSKKRYGFLDPMTLKPVGRSLAEQLEYLETFERVPTRRVAELLAEAVAYRTTKKPKKASGEIAALKERIGDIYLFVSQFVELDANGRGHCPFHDDEHKSFSVNRREGYFNCFAGCSGGDAIIFYERIKRITRGQAIRELLRLYPEEKA